MGVGVALVASPEALPPAHTPVTLTSAGLFVPQTPLQRDAGSACRVRHGLLLTVLPCRAGESVEPQAQPRQPAPRTVSLVDGGFTKARGAPERSWAIPGLPAPGALEVLGHFEAVSVCLWTLHKAQMFGSLI